MINPGVDSVAIAAKFDARELGEPPIVHNCLHWSLAPGRGVLVTKQHNRSYGVVAVREYIRFNTNQVANSAFRREASYVHFRRDSLNDDAAPAFSPRLGKRFRCFSACRNRWNFWFYNRSIFGHRSWTNGEPRRLRVSFRWFVCFDQVTI